MNLQFYLDKKASLDKDMRDLVAEAEKENRVFSEEEETFFEEMKAEYNKVEAHIERLKSLPAASQEKKLSSTSAAQGFTGAAQPQLAEPAKKEFEDLNDFMLAAITDPNDQRLEWVSAEQSMGQGAKGGFAIPKQIAAGIRSVAPETSLVRSRATVIPAGSPADSEIEITAFDQEPNEDGGSQVFAGVTVEWLEEGGLKPETDFNLRQIVLKPKEVAARIPMTDKLLRNLSAATSYAGELLSQAVRSAEDYQFMRGLGAGTPAGVIPSGAAYAVARDTASQLKFADIKAMESRFMADTGVWVAARALKDQILSLVGDGGGATNIISVNQNTGSISIYGKPVIFHSFASALGVKGDFGLYDFSHYLIKDGSGPILEVGFATGQWERNKRSIKITWNVDGKPDMTKPYRNQDNYDVSPFVVLDVPEES
jgi:HK97 family phage major capsid protein